MPRFWAIESASPGRRRLLTVSVRSRSWSFASEVGRSSIPADGTRIAEVSTSEFDDMHVTPGDTVGYAVLSKRGAVESVAAISLGPFLFLADVKDVRVEFRHREVELGWSLPRGVSEVRVIRKQGGPPRNPRDGDRIPAALDHALDRNLDPNEVYHYGIYAIYAMADGKLFPAPGVVVSARPQPPISTLDAPRLLLEPSGRVRIDWVEPARGSVKILRTAAPLPHPAGTRLSTRQAEALDGRWIDAVAPDRAIDPEPPAEGHCYYTPLAVWGDTATVGHSAALSRVSRPVRPASHALRQRPGAPLRRYAGDASLEMGRRRRRNSDRCSAGDGAAGAGRCLRDHRDGVPRRLRSSRVLDAHLAGGIAFGRRDRSRPCRFPAIWVGSAGEWLLAHQGLQRRRPGRSALDLAGAGADGGDGLAGAAPGSDGFVRSQAPLDTRASLVGLVPDRASPAPPCLRWCWLPTSAWSRCPSTMDRSSPDFLQAATAATSRSEFRLTSPGTTPACSPTRTWNLMRSFRFAFGTLNRARRGSERSRPESGRRFSALSLFCPEPASYGGNDGSGLVWKSWCVSRFRIHFVTNPIVVHWIVARNSCAP